MDEVLKGFCFNQKGQHTPAVILTSVPEVIEYCKMQGSLNYEVRITDASEDSIVMQVIDGFVTWPVGLKGMHVTILPPKIDSLGNHFNAVRVANSIIIDLTKDQS